MRLPLLLAACATLAACSASSPSGTEAPNAGDTPPGAIPPGTPPGTTPGTPTPGAPTPGAIDPTCGTSGYIAIAQSSLRGVAASSSGAVALTSNAMQSIDLDGKLDPTPKGGGTPNVLVRATDGSFYALSYATSGTSATVRRFAADLTADTSFVFESAMWPGQSIAAIAVATDRSVYVAGSVARNTSQEHVVVRHFTAAGKLDAAFAPNDDAMPKNMQASGIAIAIAKDGGVLVRSDKGFTPGILRLTSAGALDATFGAGGLLVLTDLGPRYSRAMLLDAQDRILVLGMTSDDAQIVRLLPGGTKDGAFGSGGIATIPLDAKSPSSEWDENAEARGMILDSQGRIVVSADYEYTPTPKGQSDAKPTEQTIRILRLDASGKLDATFGDGGKAKVDFGADATASRSLLQGGLAPLGAGRLLVGGTKTAATTQGSVQSGVIACVKM